MSLLQNATNSPRASLEPLVHPAREPEVLGVQDRVIGRASGKGRRFGLRSVVDDDQLVADVGVATNRVDEGSRELEVVPGEHDHTQVERAAGVHCPPRYSPLSRRGDRTETRMSSRELPLPTFLIIGAQKCATRWLRFNLGLHPDVYAASTELSFFNNGPRFADLGVSWYREQFEGWTGEPVVGEATPGYMFWKHQPDRCSERIQQVVPDARLIAILRNPIDRAQSAMIHHIASSGLAKDSDLLDLVERTTPERDRLGLITGGWYAASLEPYRETLRRPVARAVPDDIDDDPTLYRPSGRAHRGGADFRSSRARGGALQLPAPTRSRPERTPPLTIEQRRKLYEYFADDLAKLEKMLGRDLSSVEPGSSGRPSLRRRSSRECFAFALERALVRRRCRSALASGRRSAVAASPSRPRPSEARRGVEQVVGVEVERVDDGERGRRTFDLRDGDRG